MSREQNVAQMSDDLRDKDTREYLDQPEEILTPANFGNHVDFGEGKIIADLKAEIEVYKKESVLKNGLINQYKDDIARLSNKLEQYRVQLAGCSIACLGGISNPARIGDYGWSIAYQEVLELRMKYEQALTELGKE